jgi:RNA polymerase sigma-70 factor (ECF subfamily)
VALQAIFDNSWHRCALSGDAQAIDALAQAALAPLYSFCFYRVGRNRHLCEEVVQETMLRAIRDLRRYEPDRAEGNIFPWLAGLARNEIRRVLARQSGAVSLETLWSRIDEQLRDLFSRLESEPFGEDVLARTETSEIVGATMSQLPPHYREALEAKYVNGESVQQMAADRGLSEKAVESQLMRARKAFRAMFLALAQNLNTELLS